MALQASKGKAAMDNKDYQSAIIHYSEALKSSQAPTWLLQRSTAYHRLGKHEIALEDANKALHIAIDRGKRELIAEAHYKRGIVLHGLKQYGNARICFHWCHKYNEKQPGLQMWISKVKTDYDASGGDQAECNSITVKEVPDKMEEVKGTAHSNQLNERDAKSQNPLPEKTNLTPPARDSNKSNLSTAVTTPLSKIRYDWFQSQNTVTVEVLAKDIEVAKSSFRLTPHKIEVVLHKSNPGIKWSSLQCPDPTSVSQRPTSQIQTQNDTDISLKKSHAPLYPTSSKNGPKNWDAVIGGENDDDSGDGADAFFKMLYKNADLDTKRAMMKSYQESNGTSLSTQWSEVGSRKFEIVPPDGVEAKRWDA